MFMDLWIILELVTLYSGQSFAAVENELQNKNTQVTCKKKVWIWVGNQKVNNKDYATEPQDSNLT